MTATTTSLDVHAFRAPEGCVAYLVALDRDALAIDPRLDQLEELLGAAASRGLTIRAVIDTHTHADHLSGARRLAERAKAELLAPSGSKLRARCRRVEPGTAIPLGRLVIDVLPAPGHTPDAVALLIGGHLFTGDALFLEGIGRTDFPGGSPQDALATLDRFAALPPATVVHPGHDYAKQGQATLAQLEADHPVLSEPEPAERLARVSGKGATIPDIRELLAWNLAEAEGEELPPRAVQALVRGKSVHLIDVRSPEEFAEARMEGATNIPVDEIEARLKELPQGELVISCRSGVRARTALEVIQRRGRSAKLLAGSLLGWSEAGLPLVDATGKQVSGAAPPSGSACMAPTCSAPLPPRERRG